MKVYTKVVIDIDTLETIHSESFEYDGEVARCFGVQPQPTDYGRVLSRQESREMGVPGGTTYGESLINKMPANLHSRTASEMPKGLVEYGWNNGLFKDSQKRDINHQKWYGELSPEEQTDWDTRPTHGGGLLSDFTNSLSSGTPLASALTMTPGLEFVEGLTNEDTWLGNELNNAWNATLGPEGLGGFAENQWEDVEDAANVVGDQLTENPYDDSAPGGGYPDGSGGYPDGSGNGGGTSDGTFGGNEGAAYWDSETGQPISREEWSDNRGDTTDGTGSITDGTDGTTEPSDEVQGAWKDEILNYLDGGYEIPSWMQAEKKDEWGAFTEGFSRRGINWEGTDWTDAIAGSTAGAAQIGEFNRSWDSREDQYGLGILNTAASNYSTLYGIDTSADMAKYGIDTNAALTKRGQDINWDALVAGYGAQANSDKWNFGGTAVGAGTTVGVKLLDMIYGGIFG